MTRGRCYCAFPEIPVKQESSDNPNSSRGNMENEGEKDDQLVVPESPDVRKSVRLQSLQSKEGAKDGEKPPKASKPAGASGSRHAGRDLPSSPGRSFLPFWPMAAIIIFLAARNIELPSDLSHEQAYTFMVTNVEFNYSRPLPGYDTAARPKTADKDKGSKKSAKSKHTSEDGGAGQSPYEQQHRGHGFSDEALESIIAAQESLAARMSMMEADGRSRSSSRRASYRRSRSPRRHSPDRRYSSPAGRDGGASGSRHRNGRATPADERLYSRAPRGEQEDERGIEHRSSSSSRRSPREEQRERSSARDTRHQDGSYSSGRRHSPRDSEAAAARDGDGSSGKHTLSGAAQSEVLSGSHEDLDGGRDSYKQESNKQVRRSSRSCDTSPARGQLVPKSAKGEGSSTRPRSGAAGSEWRAVPAVQAGRPFMSAAADISSTLREQILDAGILVGRPGSVVFDPPSYNFSVPENNLGPTALGEVKAYSVSEGGPYGVTYILTTPTDLFYMESWGALYTNQSLDHESQEWHILEVKAVETRIPPASAVAVVRVQVEDVNEAPKFDVNRYRGVVIMGSGPGPILQVKATDPDSGNYGKVLYNLTHKPSWIDIDHLGTVSVVSSVPDDWTEDVVTMSMDVTASDPLGLQDIAWLSVDVLRYTGDVVYIFLNRPEDVVKEKQYLMEEALGKALNWTVRIVSISNSSGGSDHFRISREDVIKMFVGFAARDGHKNIPAEEVKMKLQSEESSVQEELEVVFGPNLDYGVVEPEDPEVPDLLAIILGVMLPLSMLGVGVGTFFVIRSRKRKKVDDTGPPNDDRRTSQRDLTLPPNFYDRRTSENSNELPLPNF